MSKQKTQYKRGHFTRAQIRGEDGSLYMDRWYILWFPRLFSIRLHHICRPDMDRWPHDHPWWFFSFILRGGYTEETCTPDNFMAVGNMWIPNKYRRIRFFNFKNNTDLHRITSFRYPKEGAWTLVFTGPIRREWGFMTVNGWVDRKEFGAGAVNGPMPGLEPD